MTLSFRSPFVVKRDTVKQAANTEQVIEPVLSKEKQVPGQSQSFGLPDKVYIEPDGQGYTEYSFDPPTTIDKFYDLLHGGHSYYNYIELFHLLPEIFAPINEIASRVASCVWQLCNESDDEVIYDDEDFNRLFSSPNPLQGIYELIYNAVCYEILTGRQFFYFNQPDTLVGDRYRNTLGWFNLQAADVVAIMNKNIDPYSITEINDLVQRWEEPNMNGGKRIFDVKKVIPVLRLGLSNTYDLNKTKGVICGAHKAIQNLIPVYEARGVIYVKRGNMGFIVSKKSDANGTVSLTPKEERQIRSEHNTDFGLTGNRDLIAISKSPVDFVRTSMSIEELQPFDETLADAVAIYKVLRVPRHFVPSKDNSTFANADNDTKSFYIDVIIPWAQKYAQLFSAWFGIKRRYINASFDHVELLQENKKQKADTLAVLVTASTTLYEKGVITKNERNALLGYANVDNGDTYVTDGQSPDPLVVKYGVGGTQALESILANTTISDEAKVHILVIVFGIKEKDAKKMCIPKPVDPNVDPVTGKPIDPDAPKPGEKTDEPKPDDE